VQLTGPRRVDAADDADYVPEAAKENAPAPANTKKTARGKKAKVAPVEEATAAPVTEAPTKRSKRTRAAPKKLDI
jgi:hypothetical protein